MAKKEDNITPQKSVAPEVYSKKVQQHPSYLSVKKDCLMRYGPVVEL